MENLEIKLKPIVNEIEELQRKMRYMPFDEEWIKLRRKYENWQDKYKELTGYKYFK